MEVGGLRGGIHGRPGSEHRVQDSPRNGIAVNAGNKPGTGVKSVSWTSINPSCFLYIFVQNSILRAVWLHGKSVFFASRALHLDSKLSNERMFGVWLEEEMMRHELVCVALSQDPVTYGELVSATLD